MVLTVEASEVAPSAGNGQALRARMEMVERLLLHRVYRQGTRMGIGIAHQASAIVAATAAAPRLPNADMAVVWAELALHCIAGQFLVISAYSCSHTLNNLNVINYACVFFIAFIGVGFFDPSISFFLSEAVFDYVIVTINTYYS